MDIFCSSPASTAVSSGRSDRLGLPSLGRSQTQKPPQAHNHHSSSSITPRLIRALSTPCSSSSGQALNPTLVNKHDYTQLRKQPSGQISATGSKSCCGAAADRGAAAVIGDEQLRRRRSSADASGGLKLIKASAKASSKCIVPDNRPFFDHVSISGPTKSSSAALIVAAGGSDTAYEDQHVKLERRRSSRRPPLTMVSSKSSSDENDSPKLKSSSSSSSSMSKYHRSTDKVVVLWVSLHCKGCEAKVRKHISKMEGVKSYDTDLATKRVTIISNMDPNDVLASVSKVKFAQFWPASSSSSASSRYYYPSSSTSYSPSAALLTLTR